MVSLPVPELRSEEDVKIHVLLPYLEKLGYQSSCFEFERGIEIQEGRKCKTIFPDIVVYSDSRREAPLLVCDTKAPNEILDKRAREQVISYARLLPRIAPLALLTNGSQTQVFQTLHKNRIAHLPPRDEIQKDLFDSLVSRDIQDALRAEARHELFIIDDVQTFKSVLKRCHNQIRNNEGYDPTAAFDEMSKVLFCKLLEEKTHQNNNRFRLQVFDDTMGRLGINIVRQMFQEIKKKTDYSMLFEPDTEINLSDRTIRSIVTLFEPYDLSLTGFDVKGEAFEYFLSDTFTGGLGEFFIPRNVVEFIIDAVDPKIGHRIVDPFCGTGGFLIYAFEVINEKIGQHDFADDEKDRWRWELSNRSLFGTDWKERTSQACKMNMMVHGDGNSGIFMHHGLTDVEGSIEPGLFDVCITNPPFGSRESDPEILARYELGSGRTSQDRMILAVERCLKLVKPGGTVGIVLADGLLSNKSAAYVRDFIRDNAHIRAVISLNAETFEGYGARAKTSVLILTKKQESERAQTKPVFMTIAANTGYAPNGDPVSGNQLPDILVDYREFRSLGAQASPFRSRSWVSEGNGDRLDAEFYSVALERVEGEEDFVSAAQLVENVKHLADWITKPSNHFPLETLSQDYDQLPVGDLLEIVSSRERLQPDASYKLLGVRWWGDGTFIREEKTGREIKASSLFRSYPSALIYNRLFAFRGSFAIVPPEHGGCYVSGEFPQFKVKASVGLPSGELMKYLVYALTSDAFLRVIDAQSTGTTTTSRNRFNQELFLGMTINLPRNLADVVALIDQVEELRARVKALDKQASLFAQAVHSRVKGPIA
jgi:type I restriction enzyme M protein